MNTQVSILHRDYPTRVREMVEGKLSGLERFCGRVISVRALLERHREDHRVEIVASVGHGIVLVARATEGALNAAVDACVSKLRRQLKRTGAKRSLERRRRAR